MYLFTSSLSNVCTNGNQIYEFLVLYDALLIVGTAARKSFYLGVELLAWLWRRVEWGRLGVRLAVVFGSILRSPRARDVDVLVFVDEGVDEDEAALRVMEAVENAVGLEADVYVVGDVSSVNCFLLLEALRDGVIVYRDVVGLERLVFAVGVCNDFMISRRKLGSTPTKWLI